MTTSVLETLARRHQLVCSLTLVSGVMLVSYSSSPHQRFRECSALLSPTRSRVSLRQNFTLILLEDRPRILRCDARCCSCVVRAFLLVFLVFRTEVNSDFRPMEFWERSGGRVHGRLLACLHCVTNSSKFRFISRQSRASHGDDRPPLRGGDSHLSFSWYCWQGGWQISLGNLSSVYMLVGDADTFLHPQFYSTVTIESSVGPKRNVRGVYGSCCCTSTRCHS